MLKAKLPSMIKKKYLIHILIISIIFLVDRFSKIYVINLADDLSNFNITITTFLNIPHKI